MAKTVCFGEIMLRLSPPGFERLFQSRVLGASFGGGEANVAVSLAQFGHESHYVTRVPANAIGDAALKVLRGEGVRVDQVQRGGERLGIYFAETGASQRPSTVVYDRQHSAISQISTGSVDWAGIFAGAAWFHCTGITPALGPAAAACTREALEAARRAGVKVSVDLNYRKKLWSEADAQKTMRPLMGLVDAVIANEEDLQAVLGIEVAHADVTGGVLNVEAYRQASARVASEFGVKQVAVTLRESL
jgi:2-dehydro-3-deoxygluconokinase